MEKNENQKGGLLEDGSATEEVLDSSKSVLQKQGFKGQKGLQQYYSPEALAKFVKRMIPGNIAVLDPTAGDGSLLAEFDSGYSFGIEIDSDQINASEGSYKAIKGDLQHVYTLLRMAGTEFGAIVANPPFDLTWSDPSIEDGAEISSTKFAFIASVRLLSNDGQLFFVCGRDRWERECAELPEANGVYAIIEIDDLFPDVELPCVIVCAIHPDFTETTEAEPGRQKLNQGALQIGASWAQELREEACGWRGSRRLASYDRNTHLIADTWKAVQTEYERRLTLRVGQRKSKFDVYAKGQAIRVEINAYKKIVLSRTNSLRTLESLNQHHINYFRQNEAAWRGLMEAHEDGLLTIDPDLIERVDDMLKDNRLVITPLYPLKEVQRLGFLDEIDRIKCVRTDEERGFYAGERYEIQTNTARYENVDVRFEANKKTGEWERKEYLISRRRMRVQIYNGKRYEAFYDDDEHQQDIQYLVDHFDVPDPGDMASRFPDEVHEMRVLLNEIEWDTIIPNSAKALAEGDEDILEAVEKGELEIAPGENEFGTQILGVRLRHFQREDLARTLAKVKKGGSGAVLAWEQGLGKTLAGLMYVEACNRLGSQEANLIIAPQDLRPQWQRETMRFMGKELTPIRDTKVKIENPEKGKNKRKEILHKRPVQAVAEEIAKHLRSGGTGWYITDHESLSRIGVRNKEYAEDFVVKEIEVPGKYIPGHYDYNKLDDNGYPTYVEGHQGEPTKKKLYASEICPKCGADLRSGYSPKGCKAVIRDEKLGKGVCGYTMRTVRVKPAASHLATAFKKGVVIVDEITQIGGSANGGDSARSLAVRGIRARYKLGMTGTPIKNYINQAFWIFRWAVDQKRFPYSWTGKGRFEDDFGVIEWAYGDRVKGNKRLQPEITNLSMLWKLLAANMIRRRQEESGEQIVPIRYHEHRVPLGVSQRMQMEAWMQNFHEFFAEKYPDSKLVKRGLHVAMAPMLGMMPKLEYACTLPEADPDYEWTGIEGVTNWTPTNVRVLELALALSKEGRKVLVGSATKETGRWLAEQLVEKGVNAVHILDDDGTTYKPEKRAEVVHRFQSDDVQVFCAGVQAVRLGHNLDAGSAVIITGPPWDWETFSQFVHRVRRLTSKLDIDCHIVLPHIETKTLSERKWAMLGDKSHSTELALDGRLTDKDEEKIDKDKVMQELVEAGVPQSGDEATEDEIQALWERMPMLDEYEAPEGLTTGKTVKERPHPWTLFKPFYEDLSQLAIPAVADQGGTLWREVTEDTMFSELPPEDVEPEFETEFAGGLQPDPVAAPEEAAPGDATPEPPTAPTPVEQTDPEEEDITTPPVSAGLDLKQLIRDLKELYDEGLLDEEEFKQGKADILAQLKGVN